MKCIVSQSKWVSNATNSNAIISKSKPIFWILFCISKIYIKFRILWKQRWASKVIFFLIYRLQKAGLLTCRKSPVSEHLRKGNILKGRKHCLISTTVFLSYFLITLKGKQLQKFGFSSIWNQEIVCSHIDTRWQVFCLRKSKCLTEPIQMQLSQNQKILAWFFSEFPKTT